MNEWLQWLTGWPLTVLICTDLSKVFQPWFLFWMIWYSVVNVMMIYICTPVYHVMFPNNTIIVTNHVIKSFSLFCIFTNHWYTPTSHVIQCYEQIQHLYPKSNIFVLVFCKCTQVVTVSHFDEYLAPDVNTRCSSWLSSKRISYPLLFKHNEI